LITRVNKEVFVVGGAVRDVIMGRAPKDIDFVHVGHTVEDMVGFNPVGAAFPVFLDADGSEHALARRERKVGPGYTGFECEFGPDVTLLDDQRRRDLTMNQLAVRVSDWDEFKTTKSLDLVVDSFGGIQDIKSRMIKHVSPAFVEDPVRVLRAVRFSCRFNFTIAPETIELMDQLAHRGELDHLVPERIMVELERTLMEPHAHKLLDLSQACVDAIFGHVLLEDSREELWRAVVRQSDRLTRWGALMVSIPWDDGERMMDKIGAPNDVRQLVRDLKAVNVVDFDDHRGAFQLIKQLNVLAQPARLLNVSKVLSLMPDWDLATFIDQVAMAALLISDINFDRLTAAQRSELKGKQIGETLDELRMFKIEEMFAQRSY
jgi:tRNA nucleotidyltransferase/poly(A) polymerase